MDLNTLAGQSKQVITVIQSLKNDPNFLNEFKENPQEALKKIGVELNEEELSFVQKLESLNEIKREFTGVFDKIKAIFGFKKEGK